LIRRKLMSGEMGKALAQKVTTKMPREQLEEHLTSILKEITMCTLVTSKDDIPRGTPLEYFSDGLTLFIGPDPGTKTKNLKVNPNVSISICNNLVPDWERDWQTIWGIQLTGKGGLLTEDDPEYEHARGLFRFEGYYRALGLAHTERPRGRPILKVTPSKIELLEFGLIPGGFAHRQVWRAKA